MERLQAVAALAGAQRQVDQRLIDARAEALVERRADTHQNAAAHEIENSLEAVKKRDQRRETDQRRHAAARQHPIVDLQHEERARQIEQVHDAAHHRDTGERAAARAERCGELGSRRGGAGLWSVQFCILRGLKE